MKTQDPTFGLPLALESSWIKFQPSIGNALGGSIFLNSRRTQTTCKQSVAFATNKRGMSDRKVVPLSLLGCCCSIHWRCGQSIHQRHHTVLFRILDTRIQMDDIVSAYIKPVPTSTIPPQRRSAGTSLRHTGRRTQGHQAPRSTTCLFHIRPRCDQVRIDSDQWGTYHAGHP